MRNIKRLACRLGIGVAATLLAAGCSRFDVFFGMTDRYALISDAIKAAPRNTPAVYNEVPISLVSVDGAPVVREVCRPFCDQWARAIVQPGKHRFATAAINASGIRSNECDFEANVKGGAQYILIYTKQGARLEAIVNMR